MAVLQQALDLITMKVDTYTDALVKGTAGGLFERDRDDDAYFATMDADEQTGTHSS